MIRLYDLLTGVYRAAGALCVLAMIGLLLAAIVLRELFGTALVWANEVSIALFVWSVFIGGGLAFAENMHIRFTILVERLPPALRRSTGLLVSYGGLVLLAGFWATSAYVAWVYRDQRFTTLPASAAWEWSAVPVGMVIAVLGWLRHGDWTWSGADSTERPVTRIAGT
jgi:TRAP-type C4-dicarboxylate transport system permease small subunit